jgi:hypothetical protein
MAGRTRSGESARQEASPCPRCGSLHSVPLDDCFPDSYRKCIICGNHWPIRAPAPQSGGRHQDAEAGGEPPL